MGQRGHDPAQLGQPLQPSDCRISGLRVAAQICDRVMVMQKGACVEIGPGAQVFDNPSHPYTRTLLGSFPSLTGERGDFLRTGSNDEEMSA